MANRQIKKQEWLEQNRDRLPEFKQKSQIKKAMKEQNSDTLAMSKNQLIVFKFNEYKDWTNRFVFDSFNF
jgi:hypothetical protein